MREFLQKQQLFYHFVELILFIGLVWCQTIVNINAIPFLRASIPGTPSFYGCILKVLRNGGVTSLKREWTQIKSGCQRGQEAKWQDHWWPAEPTS